MHISLEDRNDTNWCIPMYKFSIEVYLLYYKCLKFALGIFVASRCSRLISSNANLNCL